MGGASGSFCIKWSVPIIINAYGINFLKCSMLNFTSIPPHVFHYTFYQWHTHRLTGLGTPGMVGGGGGGGDTSTNHLPQRNTAVISSFTVWNPKVANLTTTLTSSEVF